MLKRYLKSKVFIRTVTYHFVGEVAEVDDKFIRLKHASWVADSGRWAHALATGELSEVEVYPPSPEDSVTADGEVIINLGAMVDISPWHHALPTETK